MGMGGAERLVCNLAKFLDRELFNPSVAWFIGDEVVEEFRDLKIPMFRVPKRKRMDFGAMREIAKIIDNNNINVVNAQHFMPSIYAYYGCKIANKATLISTFHSEWEIEEIPWRWRIIGKYVMKKLDAMVTVNSGVANTIERIFNVHRDSIFTIENGVDVDAFHKKNFLRELKSSLGIGNKDKVIGTVANFRKIKNHLLLLKAFDLLLKDMPDVKLILVGQGFPDDPDNTEGKIKDFLQGKDLADKVLLLGYRRDVANLLNIMDVFCLTSEKEGHPIALIEAMAAGLPIIGTNVKGIKDLICNGRNGYLVQAENEIGLKSMIKSLLENDQLRITMGRESYRIASESYSLKACIDKYASIFRRIHRAGLNN